MGTCKGSDYSSSAGVVNQSSYSFFSVQADWVDPWGIIFFDFPSHWSRTVKSRVKDLCEQADCWTGATFHVISCFVSLTDFSVVKATFCPLPPLSRQHPSYAPIKGKSSIKTVGWRLLRRGRNYWIIKKCFSCYNFDGGLYGCIFSIIFNSFCRGFSMNTAELSPTWQNVSFLIYILIIVWLIYLFCVGLFFCQFLPRLRKVKLN